MNAGIIIATHVNVTIEIVEIDSSAKIESAVEKDSESAVVIGFQRESMIEVTTGALTPEVTPEVIPEATDHLCATLVDLIRVMFVILVVMMRVTSGKNITIDHIVIYYFFNSI